MTANPTTEQARHHTVLVVDDDLMITEALAAGLERENRTVITCNDLESAQLVVERVSPSLILTDVRLSGPFGFEGLDFIRYAKRFAPKSRIILMTGDAPEALQLEASERGAVAFLQKPFSVESVESMIDLMSTSEFGEPQTARVIRIPILDEILTSESLHPVFQPIVRLDRSWKTMGFEALARYRTESPLRNPEVLFQYASRKKRVCDLELACVARSLSAGAALAELGPLFLNIHPDVFATGDTLSKVVLEQAQKAGVPLSRVVLEITEQGSLSDDPQVLATVEHLQSRGVRFAFDDVGVAYSHLPFIDKIRPAFLKISQHFGTSFEADSTKTKIVRNLLSLSRDFGCDLILEGIEHASTAEAAADMGIRYGQGYYFARPADASAFLQVQ